MAAEDQTASARIAEFLRQHDDLDKVSSLRTKLQKEKAVFDGQLKAGVQAQAGVTLKALERLAVSKHNVDSVRENMNKVEQIRSESSDSVENFAKISRLSLVLQNFIDVQKFMDSLLNLTSELQQVEELMARDGPYEAGNPMENLITIHYKLSKLRDVKDDAWYFAERSTDDVRRTILKHYAPLDKLVEKFDANILDIATELLDVMRMENRSLVVRTAKIIDVEERQDLAADISKEMTQDDSVLSTLKEKTSHRTSRDYPKRFFEAIENAVKETFQNCRSHFGDDIDSMLEGLDWIFQDIGMVQVGLTKCTPSRWKIFEKYLRYYHYQAYELLNHVLDQDPSAASILNILAFCKDYYANMEALGVTKEKLVPPLLDGRENKLYDDYLGLIVNKLREWKNNLSTQEKINFVERNVAPETDGDNRLGLSGEVVMFTIISQQIDVAADSGQGRILAGCVEECSTILIERQREWDKLMKQQVQLQINDSGTEEESTVPGGLVEYLIALANDQIKGADYTEAISSRIAPKVSKKYRPIIMQNLDRASDGFISLAKSCISGMINIIFADLVVPYGELFNSKAWRNGRPVSQMIITIQEYVNDCAISLNPIIFDVFGEDLLVETVLRYLGALKTADKIKPKGVERLNKDVEEFYNMFTGGVYEGDEDHAALVQSHFQIFAHFFSVLDVTAATDQELEEELLIQFQNIRGDFWDAPLDLFQYMVRARPDMDSKSVKEIMRKVRNYALQSQAPADNSDPTFLSKFQ